MRQFILDYPEWRRKGEQVAKFVSLACAIQSIVDRDDLWSRSELEQSMVTSGDPNVALQILSTVLVGYDGDDKVKEEENVRMILLYIGQYSRRPGFNVHSCMDLVRRHVTKTDNHALCQYMITWCQGVHDDHAQSDPAATTANTNLNVVDNTVYTMHVSPLVSTVDRLLKGRLSVTDYPLLQTTTGTSTVCATAADRPTDVIVFVVNGGSFQEECQLQRLVKRQYPHVRLVYGCTSFMNSRQFMHELSESRSHVQ
jgi:hypothetical protein